LSPNLYRIEYIASGTQTSGLALGDSEEDVRATYQAMSSQKEPLEVLKVYPEPA
jgi:hypothetical protein